MLWRKKENKERIDMQAENIYFIEEIKDSDWQSLKTFDAFFIKFLEIAEQTPTLKPLLDLMITDGFDIDMAKKSLMSRKSLRKRIIGDKDVDRLKEQFKLNVRELNELKIDIDYYKDKYKKTQKRPYGEEIFKEKIERQKVLEDWVLENNWIAQ